MIWRVMMLIMALVVTADAMGQEIRFSQAEWDKHRQKDEKTAIQNKELKDQNKQLKDSIKILYKVLDRYAYFIDRLNESGGDVKELFNKMEVEAAEMRCDLNALEDFSHALQNEYEKADSAHWVVVVRAANQALYSPYNEAAVNKYIEVLKGIKQHDAKKQAAKVCPLLEYYVAANAEIRNALIQIQKDPKRLSANVADINEFYDNSVRRLENTNYYQEYYRYSDDIWSIPFLDDIIASTLKALEKHNGTSIRVDLDVVIRLLPSNSSNHRLLTAPNTTKK